MIKDFFTGNFNVSVADKSRLQKSAYVKCWRLQKGLSINLEGNLVFEKKKKIVKKSDVKSIVAKTHQKQIWRMS